jgi:hypothetical protein
MLRHSEELSGEMEQIEKIARRSPQGRRDQKIKQPSHPLQRMTG